MIAARSTHHSPLDALVATHEQIEMQLDALERLVEHLGARGPDAEALAEAERVLRYFSIEAARHHDDEDRDLFPLLRRSAAAAGRVEVAAVLDELEREHASLEAQWGRLLPALQAIAHGTAGRLDAEEVTRLAWLYRRHMERETAAVLPYAREALGSRELDALAQRMSARRDGRAATAPSR